MIPFGVTMRAKFSSRFNMALEWSFRRTWTDYLDDVSTVYPGGVGSTANGTNSNAFQRGNSETNDWYMFAGITFTYRFGHKAGACYFERIGEKAKKKRHKSSHSKRAIGSGVRD